MAPSKKTFRVKHPNAAAYYSPSAEQFLVPDPTLTYEADHFMVVERPDMFEEDGAPAEPERQVSVRVENTRSRPGTRR